MRRYLVAFLILSILAFAAFIAERLESLERLKSDRLYRVEGMEIIWQKDSIGVWRQDTVRWNSPLFPTYDEAEERALEEELNASSIKGDTIEDFFLEAFYWEVVRL